ncbi:retrotransposon protein, putative, ty1-copia subclass [Tanacetum coccineum]
MRTSGIISVSRLNKDGFVNRFEDDNSISVFKNNRIYFNAIPRDDIYEIVMSSSNSNECSMYAVTNKRAKLNLDSALLWHCRLGHINKKRIEKLQHDGLLDSTNIKSLENVLLVCLFLDHLRDHGIIAHRTLPYTPQHNGVSERRNRTLLDMVRSMMSQTTLTKSFWDYALESATHILNMVPTKKVEKIPYEIWHGQAPKLSYLKVWGCEALVKRDTLTKPDKLEPKAFKCIFVGYPKKTIGYSFYYPPKNKIFVSRNAEFFENEVIDHEANGNQEENDQEIDEPQSDLNPIRRSTRTRHAPERMCLYIDAEEHELGDLGEPANYKAAMLDPESNKWLNVMNVEMQSMKDNEVWELVELPPDAKTIGHKWLFKKNTDMDGAVHTYKARLVAKGFTQTPGIDYEETFSPVVDIRAIKILIAISAFYDYEIWQMSVKTAFLNGYLNKELVGFAMKDLGEAVYILGIKIYRDRSKRLISLCQSAYIEKILKRFYMENSKRGTILMQEKLKFSKSQGASTPAEIRRMQNIPYASAVGSIMYAVRCTRFDVAFAQNITSRFQQNPGDMKRELRVSCYTDDMKSLDMYVEYIAAFDASKEAGFENSFLGLALFPQLKNP